MKIIKLSSALTAAAIAGLGLVGPNIASATVILNAGNANCSDRVFPPDQSAVVADFKIDCSTGDVTELYKSDFVEGLALGSDSGPFADSYDTLFGGLKEPPEDPTTALIQYLLGQPAISGFVKLFVLAKDGNADPTYYGWDISGWNGTEDVSITAWTDIRGAISNVSIWGGDRHQQVPEPGTLALLGVGLLGFGLMRRRGAM